LRPQPGRSSHPLPVLLKFTLTSAAPCVNIQTGVVSPRSDRTPKITHGPATPKPPRDRPAATSKLAARGERGPGAGRIGPARPPYGPTSATALPVPIYERTTAQQHLRLGVRSHRSSANFHHFTTRRQILSIADRVFRHGFCIIYSTPPPVPL